MLANVPPLPEIANERVRLREVKTNGQIEIQNASIPVQSNSLHRRHPAVAIQHFVQLSSLQTTCQPNLMIYTDGSKSENGVGCAYVVYNNRNEIHSKHYHLPNHCSVYQAELTAIQKSLDYLQENSTMIQEAQIMTDSRSSLLAIRDRNNRSDLVIQIQKQLLSLQNSNIQVQLSWVPGHTGIAGNERADELAKGFLKPTAIKLILKAPLSYAKRSLREETVIKWNQQWTSSEKGAWTRQIFPSIYLRQQAKNLKHNLVRTQFLTGHGKFGAYLHRMRIRRGPECRCGQTQDCFHLLFECPIPQILRHRQDLSADCFQKGFPLNPQSLGVLLSDATITHNVDNTLREIHHTLTEWERCDNP